LATHQRPNIVFLFSDQHRYDAAGCNGAPVCRTPAIDRIAAAGLRFTNAFTPISLCSPARGSLMTGLYPHNHGQLANTGNFNGVFDKQILDKTGYPQLLSEAGYAVSYTGKWHLPREGDPCWGIERWHTSFDREKKALGYDPNFAHEVQRLFYYMVPRDRYPTFLVDVSAEMDVLVQALQAYDTQMQIQRQGSPILDILTAFRRYYGIGAGCTYAEAFLCDEAVRLDPATLFQV
jgi:arylsulfatase A-like enzyme